MSTGRFQVNMIRICVWVMLLAGVGAFAGERIRIGAEDDWSPYSSVSKGRPVGFAVDVVRAAWAASGVDVELVPLPYARCMKEVDRGLLAGCFDTLRDPVLESRYRWHQQPLFRARIGIYGRADAGNGRTDLTLAGLRGKRVGVTHGYDYGEAFDGDATMLRDVAPSDLLSLRKLMAGRVDYVLVFDRVANAIAKEHPDLGKGFTLHGVLVEPNLYLSFSRSYPGIEHIVSQFDQGLAKVRSSGEYVRIEARWR
jgi:polar amino acid transport system substrate-binding protein